MVTVTVTCGYLEICLSVRERKRARARVRRSGNRREQVPPAPGKSIAINVCRAGGLGNCQVRGESAVSSPEGCSAILSQVHLLTTRRAKAILFGLFFCPLPFIWLLFKSLQCPLWPQGGSNTGALQGTSGPTQWLSVVTRLMKTYMRIIAKGPEKEPNITSHASMQIHGNIANPTMH